MYKLSVLPHTQKSRDNGPLAFESVPKSGACPDADVTNRLSVGAFTPAGIWNTSRSRASLVSEPLISTRNSIRNSIISVVKPIFASPPLISARVVFPAPRILFRTPQSLNATISPTWVQPSAFKALNVLDFSPSVEIFLRRSGFPVNSCVMCIMSSVFKRRQFIPHQTIWQYISRAQFFQTRAATFPKVTLILGYPRTALGIVRHPTEHRCKARISLYPDPRIKFTESSCDAFLSPFPCFVGRADGFYAGHSQSCRSQRKFATYRNASGQDKDRCRTFTKS